MKNLLTGLFILFLLPGIEAQTTDSTIRLSIKESIEYALKNQKDVLNATLDADISNARVREVTGIGLPQINASFDLRDYEKIPVQFLPDFISPSVYNILIDENL